MLKPCCHCMLPASLSFCIFSLPPSPIQSHLPLYAFIPFRDDRKHVEHGHHTMNWMIGDATAEFGCGLHEPYYARVHRKPWATDPRS